MDCMLFLELFGNIVIVVLWFHFMALTSFFIDEIVPKYSRTESLTKTWMYFVIEIILSVLIFDLSIRLLLLFHRKVFMTNKVAVNPQLWSMLTIVFSIIVFQKSFQKRAQRIISQSTGYVNKYDLYP